MNPHMIGYNISCLPDNDLHQKRLALHNQQLDEWVIHTDIPLVVLAMGYRPNDYRHDLGGRVRYIPLDQPVPVAEARNICLEDHYSSGYPWAALMDNDATLYHSPKAVPNNPDTACGKMFAEFLAENAIRWGSRFPLLALNDDE